MRKATVLALSTALLVLPAGVAWAEEPAPPAEPDRALLWPPAEGTDGEWRPAPAELFAASEPLDLCGTSVVLSPTAGTRVEYKAEVSAWQTVVQYRTTDGAEQEVVLTGEDGRSAVLDIGGEGVETYRDVDEDGVFDTIDYDYFGGSLLIASSPREVAAFEAADVPLAAYYGSGETVLHYVISDDPAAEDADFVDLRVYSATVQDACELLR